MKYKNYLLGSTIRHSIGLNTRSLIQNQTKQVLQTEFGFVGSKEVIEFSKIIYNQLYKNTEAMTALLFGEITNLLLSNLGLGYIQTYLNEYTTNLIITNLNNVDVGLQGLNVPLDIQNEVRLQVLKYLDIDTQKLVYKSFQNLNNFKGSGIYLPDLNGSESLQEIQNRIRSISTNLNNISTRYNFIQNQNIIGFQTIVIPDINQVQTILPQFFININLSERINLKDSMNLPVIQEQFRSLWNELERQFTAFNNDTTNQGLIQQAFQLPIIGQQLQVFQRQYWNQSVQQIRLYEQELGIDLNDIIQQYTKIYDIFQRL